MADRVDASGAAHAGSQLQTQLYVNKHTGKLDDAIRGAFAELAGAEFDWRSPLAGDSYAEYKDAAFLKSVGLDGVTVEGAGHVLLPASIYDELVG